MPIRVFSCSGHVAGLVILRKDLFVAAIGGSSTRHWEAGQQAQGRGLVGGAAGRECHLPCPSVFDFVVTALSQ